MVKAPKRKRYHHGNLRRALLDAALELIAESGPRGFTMREAARRAGVSSGAPYRHFADVDDLLSALVDEATEALALETGRAVARACDDPLDEFRQTGIAFVRFAVANPAHFRLMTSPELAREPTVRAEERAAIEASRAAVEASKAAGTVAAADTATQLLAARSLIYGLARMIVDGQLGDDITPDHAERLAAAVTSVLGVGLIARDRGE